MRKNGAKPKVLIVDDDRQIRVLLQAILAGEGYDAIASPCAEQAHEVVERLADQLSLILLDVTMPGMDGLEFCRQIRQEENTVPVIFLSAHGMPEERARGLEAGADDYVVKPFFPSELLARVEAVLRRAYAEPGAPYAQPSLHSETMELDLSRMKMKIVDGREVELTPTEAKLLHYLMRNAGRVLSREALLEAVWGLDFDGDSNVVDVCVGRLRRKAGAGVHGNRCIKTVRGAGYAFATD